MYDKNFEKIVQLVFGSEGGFSNHPNDRGGRTNYGVTQSTYNGWRRKKDYQQKMFFISRQKKQNNYIMKNFGKRQEQINLQIPVRHIFYLIWL